MKESGKLGDQALAIWQAFYALITNAELANATSIVGALISAGVFWYVRDLRKRVLFRLRAPEVIKDLSERASAVSNAMQDFPTGLPLIEEQVALANETLKNVERKVRGDVRKTIRSTMDSIHQFQVSPASRKERAARAVYVNLLVSTRAIEHVVADVRETP